jgi:hypothetical protein
MVERPYSTYYLDPYRESYSWLEVAIIKSSKSATSGTMPTGLPVVLPRCIQRNVNDYHNKSVRYYSVTWDIRDPTPGIKEWLELVQTGDMIVVYPNATEVGYGTELHAVEMDVYWES